MECRSMEPTSRKKRQSSGLGRRQPQPRAARTDEPVQPGIISRVAPTQRDPERVSVFIGERFAFALPAIVAVERGLKRGVELDEAQVSELQSLAEGEKAVEAALVFVSYRPRSEREVRDRLRRREFAPEA